MSHYSKGESNAHESLNVKDEGRININDVPHQDDVVCDSYHD